MIQKIADLPQRQQVMVGLLVAGGLFVFWYYVISPLGAQVTALQGREAELTETIQTLEAVRARRPQVEKEVEELEKELAQLREKLPDEKETADIVRRVEELAVGSNLDIRSFTPQATIRSDFYDNWPIRISLEGNYNNLGLFFQKVARFSRIINVDNIEIRAIEGSTPNKTLGAICTATTFVFAE